MSDTVETFEVGKLTVEIHQDFDPQNPRKEFDHLGTMVCWHRNYNLGDEHSYSDRDAFLRDLAGKYDEKLDEKLEKLDNAPMIQGEKLETFWKRIAEKADELLWGIIHKHYIVLPLYLYDHSGITMNCSGFSCPWDSGQVGYIYVSRETMLKEWNRKRFSKKLAKKADDLLRSEVAEYDQYLTGDVYGYIIKDEDGEEKDSCWGFYGLEHVKEEAKNQAEYYNKEDKQQTPAA